MGLDQYAMAVMPHPNNTATQIWWHTEQGDAERDALESKGINPVVQIAQWRKHPNLQGWMERLYVGKGGEEEFNCESIEVTLEDLDNLESDVCSDSLPETTGFFFGQSFPEHSKEDLKFIGEARKAIAQDMQVYYRSWW
jgi:hypothetical protein